MKVRQNSNIKNLFFIFFTLVVFLEYQGYAGYHNRPSDYFYAYTTYSETLSKIENNYNLDIKFSITEEEYPESWIDSIPEQNDITNLYDDIKKAKVLRSINTDFRLYPLKIFKDNIKYLYILDHIIVEGTRASAIYNYPKKSIYLATNYKSNTIIRESFHHELSSILMKRYHFDENIWRNASGKGFKYKQDEDLAYRWLYLGGQIEPVDRDILLKRGLLDQYGETGFENDFNVYAEYIFVHPEKMKELISDYPIIKRKYEVFKAFYLSIDKDFKSVFDKIDS